MSALTESIPRRSRRKCFRAYVCALTVIVLTAISFIAPLPSLAQQQPEGKESTLDASPQPDTGGACTRRHVDLTDDINDGTIDDDVATYVGRDMYVASRPEGDGPYDLSNWYAQNADSLYASFAAEAEGLTVVRGKLALNQRGSSWSGAGFRMGAAGFGSGLRPRTGDVALAVGGLDSNITSMQSKEATDAQASVSAWVHGAWLGNGIGIQGEQTDDLAFGAQLAGAGTWRAFNYNIPSVSLNAPSEPPYKTVDSWWNQSLPLVVAQHTTIDGDETRTVDYGTYTAKLQHGSQTLAERKGHGRTVAESSDAGWWVSDAPDDPAYVRTKYDNGSISHTFTFDEGHRERLITFRGDGESYWQVFEIPAEQLHSNGYAGLDFAFKDIPQDAVVVINVTGEQPVEFHNGWRFWFNDVEIGNGYYQNAPDHVQHAYGLAAQSILWNFVQTPLLTIHGGNYAVDDDGDDPAAAMLGTIVVPKGSFDSHVSTNGRVLVGQDFMMNNPYAFQSGNIGSTLTPENGDRTTGSEWFIGTAGMRGTSSVIDMNQERHNFPWEPYDCAVISWDKATPGSDGAMRPLPGTAWSVYATLDDAKNRTGALVTVRDGGEGDRAKDDGRITVVDLKPNARYYLREDDSVDDYRLNENIYAIDATGRGDATNSAIATVYDGEGNALDLTAPDALLKGNAIINIRESSISWGKTAQGDDTHTPLAGSTWQLTDPDGGTHRIIDGIVAPETITILRDGKPVSGILGVDVTGNLYGADGALQGNGALTFDTRIAPDNASQEVVWNSSNPIVSVQQGRVRVVSDPSVATEVTISATSIAVNDGEPVSASIRIIVYPQPMDSSLTVKYNGKVAPDTLTVELGTHTQLVAKTTPAHAQVEWASSDPTVASIDDTGNLHAATEGVTTITARYREHTVSIVVHVVHSRTVTIYLNLDSGIFSSAPRIHYGIDGVWTDWNNAPTMRSECLGNAGEVWSYTITTSTRDGIQFMFKDDQGHELKGATGGNFSITGQSQAYTVYGSTRKAYVGIPELACHPADGLQSFYILGENDQASAQERYVLPVGQTQTIRLQSPSGDVIWESDNPEVARIDPAPDGRSATITALAKGVTTVSMTCGGVTLSVTVVAAGDELTAIYLNWPGVTGVYMRYGYDDVWSDNSTDLAMLPVDGCGDGWSMVMFPRSLAGHKLEFTFRADGGAWYGGGNLLINNETTIPQNAYSVDDHRLSDGAPGCAVAQPQMLGDEPQAANDARMLSKRLARIPLFTAVAAMQVIENSDMRDIDARAGMFTVRGLAAGTWKLREIDAPVGYLVNEHEFSFVVHADGSVTWDGGTASTLDVVQGIGWISDAPSKVQWSKVDADADGAPVIETSPSAWRLEQWQCDEDGTCAYRTLNTISDCTEGRCTPQDGQAYYDADPVIGHFTVLGLPAGVGAANAYDNGDGTVTAEREEQPQRYRLLETQAPTGYAADSQCFYFAIEYNKNPTAFVRASLDSYDQTTGEVEGGQSMNGTAIVNRRLTGSVQWRKTSPAPQSTLLPGSQWSIEYKLAEGAEVMSTIVADCIEEDSCRAQDGAPQWAVDLDPQPGVLRLRTLPWGIYTMREHAAPDGYYLDPQWSATFTIDADNACTLDEDGTVSVCDSVGVFNVENEPGVVLPDTGGAGAPWQPFAGFVIVMGVMVVCAASKRRGIYC